MQVVSGKKVLHIKIWQNVNRITVVKWKMCASSTESSLNPRMLSTVYCTTGTVMPKICHDCKHLITV